VRSRTTPRFRKALAALPSQIQEQAREAYRQFQRDPWHPGLRFKKVHPTLPIYSARVGLGYRAVGLREENDTVVWYWIGSHAEYDTLTRRS
jgi:mRNA-degrading endonuclease RelE of RelBE toxin-antitoxin system